jgi:serine/threonine protein kinase
MSNPSYESRWEVFEKDPIGRGGQGEVFRVKDKTKSRDTQKIGEETIQAVRRLGSAIGSKEDKYPFFELLKRAIEDISKGLFLQNQAALKVLHKPEDARDPENAEGRIKREMEAMARVEHPNLLRILDKDVEEKWFVAEYHPCGTLREHIDTYTADLGLALRSIRPVVDGVAKLHTNGLVHRDIKPENIFKASDGRLVLGDFGLTYFQNEQHTRYSATFENVGSWDWMPPWAQGIRVDKVRPTFDVFSLGKVIWAMISEIEKLKLWYYDRERYNVQTAFPDSPAIHLANPLFAKCIVQEEEDCLPNAKSLLEEIDHTLTLIQTHLRRQRLKRKYKETFYAGQPRSVALPAEQDYSLARMDQFQEIHIVILSVLHKDPPPRDPNEWLLRQPQGLIDSAYRDLVTMGMVKDSDSAPGHLKTPADYHLLMGLLSDEGKRFVEQLLSD